jgi:hypothetical protein
VKRIHLNARTVRLVAVSLVALAFTACAQRMAKQPSHRPLTESDFFADRRSARPLEEGVIHRTQYLSDSPLVSGLTAEGKKPQTVDILDAEGKKISTITSPGIANKVENFTDQFPFPLTEAHLKRGQERYTIYCTPCHGTLGDGMGKIRERGYFLSNTLTIPNYHTDNSRGFGEYYVKVPLSKVPVGYFFEVITRGYGGMPDHASQISVEDRWKIAAYVRALQLSRNADLKTLPKEQQDEIKQALGGK